MIMMMSTLVMMMMIVEKVKVVTMIRRWCDDIVDDSNANDQSVLVDA